MKIKVLFLLAFASFPALADWATAPNLESRVLWQLVAEGRAEVVSSVAFGTPTGRHAKQTVFVIREANKSEGQIKWAIKSDGTYRPVMCTESWESKYNYLGSSCSIPGCNPESEACIKELAENL